MIGNVKAGSGHGWPETHARLLTLAYCDVSQLILKSFALQDPRVLQRVEAILQDAYHDGILYLACNGCYEGDWPKVSEARNRCGYNHPLIRV